MTRHIRPLYVSAHLNRKLVSKVLMDNGSAVNVMPFGMLKVVGRSVDDLIETEVAILGIIREISKTLGTYQHHCR